MKETLKDYKESKILSKPFSVGGEPNITTGIVATLIDGRPLSRKVILTKLGFDINGKSEGFMCNHFAELSNCGIIRFSKSENGIKQGENFQKYLNYIFITLLKADKKIVDSLKHKLLPKKGTQAVDFITGPEDDVFNKPNPFLDIVIKPGEKRNVKSIK